MLSGLPLMSNGGGRFISLVGFQSFQNIARPKD
jgi:hypothetical protein